jgi:hypothetical protein
MLGELAGRWGVVRSEKGCTVWFEVGRRRRLTKRQDDVAARRLRASAGEMAAAIRDLLRRP